MRRGYFPPNAFYGVLRDGGTALPLDRHPPRAAEHEAADGRQKQENDAKTDVAEGGDD